MSGMEYNKGKLIPVDRPFKDIFEDVCGVDVDPPYGTYEEYVRDAFEEFGYVVLKGKPYEVIWESNSQELYEINNTVVLEDGSISFETYHYNGGGHWTELVEKKL